MMFTSKILVFALMMAVGPAAPQVLADDPSATKRTELYYVAAGKTYNMHANDHARMLGKYAAATGKPVPAEVVREHTAAIRANVANAQKAYAKLAEFAKTNPGVAKQLAEINKQLASVSQQVKGLESDNQADSKLVLMATSAISQDLKTTHLASKEIDRALAASQAQAQQTSRFDNLDSQSYYFTGEGHFID